VVKASSPKGKVIANAGHEVVLMNADELKDKSYPESDLIRGFIIKCNELTAISTKTYLAENFPTEDGKTDEQLGVPTDFVFTGSTIVPASMFEDASTVKGEESCSNHSPASSEISDLHPIAAKRFKL
jgi:hypothetical protein